MPRARWQSWEGGQFLMSEVLLYLVAALPAASLSASAATASRLPPSHIKPQIESKTQSRPVARPRLVPASPNVCSRHVREAWRSGSETASCLTLRISSHRVAPATKPHQTTNRIKYTIASGGVPPPKSGLDCLILLLYFLFTLVTGPRRALSLKLSDTRVYEPGIRTRLIRAIFA